MKKRMLSILIAMGILTMGGMNSCTNIDDHGSIVGTWYYSNHPVSAEVATSNDSVTAYITKDILSKQSKGSIVFTINNTIIRRDTSLSKAQTGTYQVEGSQLFINWEVDSVTSKLDTFTYQALKYSATITADQKEYYYGQLPNISVVDSDSTIINTTITQANSILHLTR